jgi:fructuronate reductase
MSLSERSLTELQGISVPNYDRKNIRPGVLHIGVGNFHRGHQAVYFDDLLESDPQWGIVGVSMRSGGTRDRMAPQDHLYTVCEKNGAESSYRIIGSILEVLVLAESRQKILNLGANSDISCITLTVTENGYCHTNSGDLNWQHPEITHDLENPDSPISVPGLLVSLLDARMRADGGPINLISCDNLSANGRVLQSVVSQLAEHRSAELAKWIAQNVAFPNTMVDRIVPATSDEDIEVFAEICFADNALITTEGFTQWVIEDCLVGNVPLLAQTGVLLTADVGAFETMKLRFLNATHSTLAYSGLLLGYKFIHEALEDPLLNSFATQLMSAEIAPVTETPDRININDYQQSVLSRFGNAAVPYKTSQVATNGSLKLPQRIFPTIESHLQAGEIPRRLCIVVACWLACLSDTKLAQQFTDPVLPIDPIDTCSGRTDLLGHLASNELFTQEVDRYLQDIKRDGIASIISA